MEKVPNTFHKQGKSFITTSGKTRLVDAQTNGATLYRIDEAHQLIPKKRTETK